MPTKQPSVPATSIPERCPRGCGAKRYGIAEGIVYYKCGTMLWFVVKGKPRVRPSYNCRELLPVSQPCAVLRGHDARA